jgi:N6-adenosine-specific RNA methylase IME4
MNIHPAASVLPFSESLVKELAADMAVRGYDPAHPITLYNGEILDGRHRWSAAQMSGVKPTFYAVPPDDNPWEVARAANKRRHLSELERLTYERAMQLGSEAHLAQQQQLQLAANAARSAAAVAQHAVSKPWAGETKPRDGAPANAGRPSNVTPIRKPAQPDAKRSNEARDLAQRAGVTPAQAERYLKIEREVATGKVPNVLDPTSKIKPATVGQAQALIKQAHKHELAEELAAKPLPQVTGTFDVIVIDPPWQYQKRAEDVTHRGRNPYPDMSQEQILALPVSARSNLNCVLWLWTTNAFMEDAFECLRTWGFQNKTILTWAKDRMGTGDWLRGKTEHCLLAVRGKPTVLLTNQTTLLEAPLREHSRKPDEFFKLVETLCPGAKLEMFAREPRSGWQVWGAETEKFICDVSK